VYSVSGVQTRNGCHGIFRKNIGNESDRVMGMGQPILNRRAHDRSPFHIECSFTLESGEVLSGQTTNISLRGVAIGGIFGTRCAIGSRGGVRLKLPGLEDRVFPCVVVHISPRGIGLHIRESKDNFGHVVTQAIFGDMTSKIGSEGQEWADFDVSLKKMGGQAVAVKIVKLNIRNADLRLPVGSDGFTGLLRETRVDVTIRPRRGAEVKVSGTLVDYPLPILRGGVGEAGSVVRVSFNPASDPGMGGLAGLIRMTQEKRLANIIHNRAAANSLLSHESPTRRPSRSEIKRDLDRFFAFKKRI